MLKVSHSSVVEWSRTDGCEASVVEWTNAAPSDELFVVSQIALLYALAKLVLALLAHMGKLPVLPGSGFSGFHAACLSRFLQRLLCMQLMHRRVK